MLKKTFFILASLPFLILGNMNGPREVTLRNKCIKVFSPGYPDTYPEIYDRKRDFMFPPGGCFSADWQLLETFSVTGNRPECNGTSDRVIFTQLDTQGKTVETLGKLCGQNVSPLPSIGEPQPVGGLRVRFRSFGETTSSTGFKVKICSRGCKNVIALDNSDNCVTLTSRNYPENYPASKFTDVWNVKFPGGCSDVSATFLDTFSVSGTPPKCRRRNSDLVMIDQLDENGDRIGRIGKFCGLDASPVPVIPNADPTGGVRVTFRKSANTEPSTGFKVKICANNCQ